MNSDNITIRLATPDDAVGITQVNIDTWKTAYVGFMPQALLDGLQYEDRAEKLQKVLSEGVSGITYVVAEDFDRKIVGFVGGGKRRDNDENFDAELYFIYVLDSYQGKGIGRRLTECLTEYLTRDGLNSMKVWTIKEYSSVKFYQALGAQLTGQERSKQFDGHTVVETALGWPNLSQSSLSI